MKTFDHGVDIVVVTYNARVDVMACLASLHAHPPARPWKLFVVDNASTDGTPDAIEQRWPEAVLTRMPANAGFAVANNVGIAQGSHELVLLLNSDTIVPPGQIERLCDALAAHQPEVGIVGPRLVDGNGRTELSFGPMMGPLNEAVQKVRGWVLTAGPAPLRRQQLRRLERPHLVDWVSGACLLARRQVLRDVGGFDERYFMYAEDVDLCAAARLAGYHVRFSPEAQVVHVGARSRATAASATYAHYRRSQLAFYKKHHPRWAPLLRVYLGVRRR